MFFKIIIKYILKKNVVLYRENLNDISNLDYMYSQYPHVPTSNMCLRRKIFLNR